MKPKRKETEKNNRREALSAIILSSYTVHLVGSEPTTCALEHTTIYHRMPFIESRDELQHHTFISDDPAEAEMYMHGGYDMDSSGSQLALVLINPDALVTFDWCDQQDLD